MRRRLVFDAFRGYDERMVDNVEEKAEVDVNEITLLNAQSGSFDFLKDEPELYSLRDVKKKSPERR